ncbi:hypothetical protein NQD34_013804 [Periophthalmus magnuspinnatus]|nr:hypothetical protein NQD34_013804 [Periophthalmus magnuspinnatus]
MSFGHRQAAYFAGVKRIHDFVSGHPDIEGFIHESVLAQLQDVRFYENFTKDDWKDSSDDDSYWAQESDAERKAGSLLDEKKIKEKAEKKRLKKQRQKERKRLEKQQNATQDDKIKDTTSEICNTDKEYLNLRNMASSLDAESSDNISDGSGNEDEGLDLTSSFVTKAAEIAKRQLEQKQEIKDKKKSPVKEAKTPEKPHEANHDVNKPFSSPKMEDFVKISAEFAMFGNKLAAAGDYKMAVKYFTDAIKYNPTEYRLFGNRAFCFERMQEYEKSLSDAQLSLSMSPGWVRGLFRKGRALAGLKRYEEAACAFMEIIELNGSSPEAAQELMNVQISQLMVNGFTREQSSNALVIHGNVEKAQEVLSKLNKLQVSPPAPVPVQQVANMTGVSPGLSAKAAAAPCPLLPPAQDASKTHPPEKKPLIPVQNQQSQPKPNAPVALKSSHVAQAPELFPVWVGNLSLSVTENSLRNLFNKVGTVYSIKQLPAKRCAFINYTQQQHCDDAIWRYHGFELMGSKLAVRYPDRIPPWSEHIQSSPHI